MNRFFILTYTIFLSIIYISNINSQTISSENKFLKQSFLVAAGGGIGYGFTDYKNSSLGLAAKSSLEYYPLIIQDARFGFKIFGGGLNLKFDDPRNSVSSNDGPREIPNEVSTDAVFFGAGLNFGYAISDFIIPSIMVGGTYLNFSPKNIDGKILEFNSLNRYDKSVFVFMLEGNINFKISDRFSLNTSLSYQPTSMDYLEDLSAANNSDSYITAMIGISYAIHGSFDPEKDNTPTVDDKHSQKPEDFIGLRNEVVPKDSITVIPETDDKSLIENENQVTPNIEDKPIEEQKDINKPQDEETFYQFNLRGEDLFINSSSKLKENALIILNEIAFYIQNQPKSKWRIEGHMDSQGSAYTIKKISYDRAKAVFDYIVSQGVLPNQIEVYGLGDSFPVGNNNTAEGRNANRRIMIIRED
ncbi:MAG: OmpA family protein [Ignavibacteriaceae bacterium]|jgi:outer membrane protein OmpA-like peptidoglycan-associated protein|nr:OmpA family protein [Ignavibacteriaceae bacterium]